MAKTGPVPQPGILEIKAYVPDDRGFGEGREQPSGNTRLTSGGETRQ